MCFYQQMNYEDFCHIASVCAEQIGPKCRRFFSPSNFMKFEKDESGRIAILPFYLYVMRTVGFVSLPLKNIFTFIILLTEMTAHIKFLLLFCNHVLLATCFLIYISGWANIIDF